VPYTIYAGNPDEEGQFYELDENGDPELDEDDNPVLRIPLEERNLNQRVAPNDHPSVNPPNDKTWWEKIGTVTATGGAMSVRVKYDAPGDCWVVADAVMAVRHLVDIDTDTNNDGIIDLDNESTGTDDPIEVTSLGKGVAVNSDDDNNNGVPDFDDIKYGFQVIDYPNSGSPADPTGKDDDLVEFELNHAINPAIYGSLDGWAMKLVALDNYDPNIVKVWRKDPLSESGPMILVDVDPSVGGTTWSLADTNDLFEFPKSVWLEFGAEHTIELTVQLAQITPTGVLGAVFTEDTAAATSKLVDLDIDSDNNGYINTPKNKGREDAEDALEETVGKPITFFGESGVDEAEHPDPARYVPLRLSLSPPDKVTHFSVENTDNVEVFKKTAEGTYTPIESGDKTPIADRNTVLGVPKDGQHTLYVKAVDIQPDADVTLKLWEDDTVVDSDKVKIAVQDNTQELISKWVIPNDWIIGENYMGVTRIPRVLADWNTRSCDEC